MKLILLFASLLIFSFPSYSQYEIYFEFDGEDDFTHLLSIDSINNPANIWEIGVPQKEGFDDAYSAPNVIGTGLNMNTPVNNNSTFIVTTFEMGGYEYEHTVLINGQYWVNSDSLNDYGMIETSLDNGDTWIDLLDDSIIDYYNLWYEKPVLTGNSNGWQFFEIFITPIGENYDLMDGDTILYRFSYITDSIQDSLPGLMFDNLYFENYFESINEQNTFISKAYPSPATDYVNISFNSNKLGRALIEMVDLSGKVIYSEWVENDNNYIKMSGSPSGVYYYRITSGKEISTGNFIKI